MTKRIRVDMLEFARVNGRIQSEVHLEANVVADKGALRRHGGGPEVSPERGGTEIILASASPRRSELLGLTGWRVRVHPVQVDETPGSREAPLDLAVRLAREKAEVAADSHGEDAIVLGADTVVADGRRTLGKPEDEADAARMLNALRGRAHQVITALTIIHPGGMLGEVCLTEVPMRAYEQAAVRDYIASGKPMDKAGAYGIQDREFDLVDVGAMRGCFANVMGFPICHFTRAMRRLGETAPRDAPIACQNHTGYDCAVYPEILRGDS